MTKNERKTLMNAKNLLTQVDSMPIGVCFTAKDLNNVHGATLAYWCDMAGYTFSHNEKMWVQVNEDTILRKEIKVYVKIKNSQKDVYERQVKRYKQGLTRKLDSLNKQIVTITEQIEMLENF